MYALFTIFLHVFVSERPQLWEAQCKFLIKQHNMRIYISLRVYKSLNICKAPFIWYVNKSWDRGDDCIPTGFTWLMCFHAELAVDTSSALRHICHSASLWWSPRLYTCTTACSCLFCISLSSSACKSMFLSLFVCLFLRAITSSSLCSIHYSVGYTASYLCYFLRHAFLIMCLYTIHIII